MAFADSSEVDAALMAKLSGDSALMGLCPDGVFWEVSTADVNKFVIVSQVDHGDAYVLPGRVGWERFSYLVKAVTRGASGTDAKRAAFRIYELLQDATLTATGYYVPMVVQRTLRVRYLEVDHVTDQRWQHRGGHYEVLITPH